MTVILRSFGSLYFATVLMLIGSGLLSTYLALRLSSSADGLWVGALMAAYYFGLVLGGKVGHRLIARVGHIRAYVACAGVVTAAVLGHGLSDWLPSWLFLRALVGLGMMCQYMVIESWLNEQAESDTRGRVFAGYMIAFYAGMILGQLILVVHPQLGSELLMVVALCFALCLVPIALTRKMHPKPLHPAPMELPFFIKHVPLSLTTIAVSGLMVGAFYGLAPLYGARMGLTTEQVGVFMGCLILAGVLVQAPLGWLSDRYERIKLIRSCTIALAVASLPLAVMTEASMATLLVFGFIVCALQFCLYPLAVALANDHVEADRRVSLTAVLLVVFGVGACAGPLLAGLMMRLWGANMLYVFFFIFSLILIIRVRPALSVHLYQDQDAPLQHVAMPDGMVGSPLAAALDPRVDEQVVQEQMVAPAVAEVEARQSEAEKDAGN
ncbi:MFS transporter [Pseudomonas sp. TTU2014-080ASC]|uniref:MFS transporter n=1 Tax=Pseudomonas sp. TTU2014-080ASC TaxID=1729724 RepID=UPI00071865D6|nr:MFS transporter [Pseudomonas sp. TTU2014-080ASC]KRW62427.1 MFS transporter [Pseudomonas sp. TTU2014-080ASC]